jgi:peptidoglycan/LPS O-acetylase OafA/YrhL
MTTAAGQGMRPAGDAGRRYPGLDLLRATAILWVMLFHAMTEGLGRPLRPVGDLGWMGVDLFFVLSGYLIGSQLLKSYARGETPSAGAGYVRRAFRILPAYWVVLACYFLFPAAREARGIQPAWQFLTFTENLLVDYEHNRAFSHAWSLCVEEHFYLFVPVLIWLLMRRSSWKTTAAVCAAIFLGGMALRAWIWRHGLDGGAILAAQPWRFVELIYYPTYVRLDGLMAGMIVATVQWFRPEWWRRAMDRPYWLLGAGAAGMAAVIGLTGRRTGFGGCVFAFPLLAASMALIVAAAVSPKSLLDRIRVPGAGAIATITFSLYLSHKMTWQVIRTRLPDLVADGGWRTFVVYATAALGVGAALYFLVERPFLRLRDRLRDRRALATAGRLQASGVETA